MKTTTAQLLKKHLEDQRFEFNITDNNVEFTHNFNDDEILELVQSEYGTSLTQPVDELFKALIKRVIKIGVDHAKVSFDINSDKLSDL